MINSLNNTSVLFYISLGMWVISRLIKSLSIASDLALMGQILLFCSFALLGIFFLTKIDANRPISWFPMVFIALMIPSAINGQDTVLLQGLVFAYCSRYCNFETAAKIFLVIISIVAFFAVATSLLGLIPNNVVYITGRTRMSLGFIWPSRLPNLILTMACLYVYLKRDRSRISVMVFIGICACVVFNLTGSRNPFVFTMLLLALTIFLKIAKLSSSSGFGFKVCIVAFAACAALSVGLSWAYDPSVWWMRELNSITTRRMYLSNLAFQTSPYSLWGTDVFLGANSEEQGFLDGSYLQLWFYYGLIAFVLVIAAWTLLMRRAVMSGDGYLVVILLCLAFHSVLEGQLLVLEYTPFMLLIFDVNYYNKGKTLQYIK